MPSVQALDTLSSRSAAATIWKLLNYNRMGYDNLLWIFAGLVVFGFAISLRRNNLEHYGAIIPRYGVLRPLQATGSG